MPAINVSQRLWDVYMADTLRQHPYEGRTFLARQNLTEMRNAGVEGDFSRIDYEGRDLSYYIPVNLLTPKGNETDCYCEACKAKRGDTNSLRPRRMHVYSHKPKQWIPRRVEGDRFPYLMGVELETTMTQRDCLSNNYAVDMRRPRQFWLAKRDGSVSGPEFASHPATLTWWHEAEGELREMFKLLTHGGFTSHTGAEAGMHVNIGREAFDGADHLERFLNLVTTRPAWSIKMAQRDVRRAQQWARLRQYSRQDAEAAASGHTRYLTNKYSVVNILNNRYEFRFPRGTLRIDRFFKNLEWTAGMIGFTRQDMPVSEAEPMAFMEWLRNFPTVYSNVNAFIEEKRTALEAETDINSPANLAVLQY